MQPLEAQFAHPPPRPAPARSDLPLTADDKTDDLERETASFSLSADNGDRQTAVLNIGGEVDLDTAPQLLEVLLPVLDHGSGPVVIDLSDLRFIDSTGVQLLVDIHKRLERRNRRLAIVCREHERVHRLLALLGVLDALTVHHSRQSAVAGGDGRIRSEPAGDRPAFTARTPHRNQPGNQTTAQPA